MQIDRALFFLLHRWAGASDAARALAVFFAAYFQYVLVALFFLFLLAWRSGRREKLECLLAVGLSAAVARLGVTELIRFFYHRPRPFLAYGTDPFLAENAWSFPSGHSTFFFAASAALYAYNKKAGIGFFIASIILNAGRVAAGVHYPSDILGGMVIGVATAIGVVWVVRRFSARIPFLRQAADKQ
ncbi:MAG: phosphatase PAP2 family protein [Candidatus Niyogibacteria bacterium]|nr:phosphatase PAP2 family protein [Candidatus Niyogibacteria bacterium]